jgi:hypothetical protein
MSLLISDFLNSILGNKRTLLSKSSILIRVTPIAEKFFHKQISKQKFMQELAFDRGSRYCLASGTGYQGSVPAPEGRARLTNAARPCRQGKFELATKCPGMGVGGSKCAHTCACIHAIATFLCCAVQPVDKCPTTYRMPGRWRRRTSPRTRQARAALQ